MRKDTTIFTELQEFFQQNDTHRAINHISSAMNSLKLHKSKIGKLERSAHQEIIANLRQAGFFDEKIAEITRIPIDEIRNF